MRERDREREKERDKWRESEGRQGREIGSETERESDI